MIKSTLTGQFLSQCKKRSLEKGHLQSSVAIKLIILLKKKKKALYVIVIL